MAQDNPSGMGALTSLLKRLFGGGQTPASPADTPQPTYTPPPPLVITDENRAEWKQFAQSAPFAYGYWSQVKRLYKAAETAQDWDILQPLAVRLDTQPFTEGLEMLPTPLSEAGANTPARFAVAGTMAYLLTSGYSGSLNIVDVSDAVQPRLLGKIDITNPVDIVVEGGIAYVLEGGQYYGPKGALHVVDVSDPAQPRRLAAHDVKQPLRLAQMGPLLAVAGGDYREGSLTLLNVSNPLTPLTLSNIKIDLPIALAARERAVYVLSGEYYQNRQKITTYDVSDPIRPRTLADINMPGAANVQVHNDHVFVTVANSNYYETPRYKLGLHVYRPENDGSLAAPPAVVELGNAGTLTFSGSRAFVGVTEPGYSYGKESGLKILDISVSMQPRVLGEWKGGIINHAIVSPQIPNVVFLSLQIQPYGSGRFHALDVSRPEQPFLLGALPSNKTIGYMKRRVRRALRMLADQNPAQYVQQATELLLTTGREREELNTWWQWVSMDILYGKSRSYEQASHGRGQYLLRGNHLRLRTREERYPEFWDRYPQQAEKLYATLDLPWQTQEAACKMLRGMKRALPDLPDANLSRFLQSPSPLLVMVATRALAAKLAHDETIPADLAAETFYKGSGRSRQAVRDYIARQTKLSSRWSNAFAARLYKLAEESYNSGQPSRRKGKAIVYLVAQFPEALSKHISPDFAVGLYETGAAEALTWGLNTFRQVSVAQLDVWLPLLEPLPDNLRAPALAALTESVVGRAIPAAKMRELVTSGSEWIRRVGWDLIAASTTPDNDLISLWDNLLAATEETDALRTATASPSAIALFNRLTWDGTRLQGLLETRPFLVGLLPQSALQNIVRVLPVASILGLVQAATDAQWPELRQTIVNGLEQSGQISAFWQLAWKHVGTANNPLLTARLLEDDVLSATFLPLNDPEFLNTGNPIYNAILGRWVRVHEALFAADSPLLLQIATHMLPDIRAWGLERVRQVGMRMPFALRLLESELPPAMELGKTFFEAVPTEDEHAIEYITALCDSPKAPVRAYGRQYLEARWEGVSHEAVFSRLSEHTDPQMEAFLAERLLKTEERFAHAPTFDRQVLRARSQGRKAKELVKRRLDAEPSHDIPLLLELARGRSSRDAEWALGQLARLAVAGVKIEGVEVEEYGNMGI